jgi:hypothetical protein
MTMAEIDPNIALQARPVQFDNPMDLQAKALQIRQLGLQTQAQQRDYQNQQTLADLYRSNIGADGSVDHNAIIAGMAKSGLGAQIPNYQKSLLDVTKTKADIGETVAKTSQADATTAETQLKTTLANVQNVGNHLYSLAQDPNLNHDSAYGAINSWVNQGIIKPDQGASIARSLPGDPTQLKAYMLQKATEGQGIEQQLQTRLANLPKQVYEDTGAQKVGIDTNPLTNGGQLPTLQKSMTPDEAAKVKLMQDRGTFSATSGDLLASLSAKGISLPAGMRSKEQQIATLNGLIRKYPSMSPDEIAENIGNGQINFGSDKKAATVAAGQEGKVSTAVNELSTFGDQVLEASAKVPRGNFVPATALMQMADSSISDPNLLKLKLKLNALNNAYNVLSARGGTDAVSRGHVAQLFSAATGPEGMAALVQGLKEEGAGAQSAAAKASHVGVTANAGPPVPVKSDSDYNALKSGTRFTAPDGSVRVKP